MSTDVSDFVRTLLADVLGCPHDAVTVDARLVDDLGCDSLGLFELAFGLNQKYGIELIPDENEDKQLAWNVIGQLSSGTVSDLIAVVEKAVEEMPAHG